MEAELTIAMALSVVNLLMVLGIIGINIKSYLRMKAQYTMFMIIFASLFAVQYWLGLMMFFTNMPFYNAEVGSHILMLTVLQTVAFGYLLWMELQ